MVLVSFVSCGLTDSEKESIKFSINLHNMNQHLKFSLDSIQEATNYEISELVGVIQIPKKERYRFIGAHMAVWCDEWNDPYRIERDYNLTLDSYLLYCKTMGYDPKTYINIINK
jgi:hypothetical protein